MDKWFCHICTCVDSSISENNNIYKDSQTTEFINCKTNMIDINEYVYNSVEENDIVGGNDEKENKMKNIDNNKLKLSLIFDKDIKC